MGKRQGIKLILIISAAYAAFPTLALGSGGPTCEDNVPSHNRKSEAQKYCAEYVSTDQLRQFTSGDERYSSCVEFYVAVLESKDMICAYAREEESLLAEFQSHKERVDIDAGAQDVAKTINAKATQIISKYYSLGSLHYKKVTHTYLKSMGKAKDMLSLGTTGLDYEVHCQRDGNGNSPPGFVIVGLATVAIDRQEFTGELWRGILLSFNSHITFVRQLTSRHDTKDMVAEIFSTAPSAVDSLNSLPLDSPIIEGAIAIAEEAGKKYAHRKTRDFLHNLVKTVPKRLFASSYSGAAGSAERLIFGGDIDELAVAEIGVGVIAAACGAPFTISLLVGVGTSVVIDAIRNQINENEKKNYLGPYAQWAKRYQARQNPAIWHTSGSMARAYRPVKEKMDYCGKCPPHYGTLSSIEAHSPEEMSCKAHNRFNSNWQTPSKGR